VRLPTFGALSRYDKSGGACKPDSPDEFAISRPFCKLLKFKCSQHILNVNYVNFGSDEIILGTVWALWLQRKISGSFGEKGAVQYLCLLGIAQTCRSSRNRSSASSCRNLQTSTDTENGAECIRTGYQLFGERLKPSRR